MSDFLYLSGFVLASVMTLCAFFAWRKAQGFHVLLLESTNRFIAMRNRGTQLEAENQKAEEKLNQIKEINVRLEKALGFERQKNDTILETLRQENSAAKDINHQQMLKIDHLGQQVGALMEQAREAEYLRKEAEKKLAYASHDSLEKQSLQKQSLAQEIDQWKKKCRLIESEFQAFRQKAETDKRTGEAVDPNLHLKVKRKASHFESLYKSMRGLREMADERNKNWEIALRKLSAYILRHAHDKREVLESQAIGPMVGEALDVIGARLMDDEFSSPGPGATKDDQKNYAT